LIFIPNKTTTIIFISKPSPKTLPSIIANNPYIIKDQGKRKMIIESSLLDFSLIWLETRYHYKNNFFLWWVLHNHIIHVIQWPFCEHLARENWTSKELGNWNFTSSDLSSLVAMDKNTNTKRQRRSGISCEPMDKNTNTTLIAHGCLCCNYFLLSNHYFSLFWFTSTTLEGSF